ncbi:MAG: hypothetical protein N3D17_02490 [bacterium]|nr:hypothetical protein [bacterium]
MKKMVVKISMLLIAGLCIAGFAQEEGSVGFGAGIKLGTPGPGIEVAIPFTDKFGGRINLNYFTYDYDTTQEGIKYEAELNLMTIGATIDWYPTGRGFRLTGGVFYNGNEITGKGEIGPGGVNIGGTTYTSTDVGKLKAKADFDTLSPYIGIGWDTSFGGERQWGFIGDVGILYHGSPNIKLSSKGGTLSDDPTFLANLKKEEKEIEDNVEDFVWYPVITVGLIYRF